MIHHETELRLVSPEIGYGVFAKTRIPKGTITWVQDEFDIVLTDEQMHALPAAYAPILERYAFLDSRGRNVLCWDHGRFVNHSCTPTTVSVGRLCDIAVRDVQPGEELTADYSLLNLDDVFDCRCGSPQCRGKIRVSALSDIATDLDRVAASAAPSIPKLEQPLIPFMLAPDRERLQDVLAGRQPLPSCIENRYVRPQARS